MKLSGDYEQNLRMMDNIVKNDPTVKIRNFEAKCTGRLRCRIYFSDGLVNSQLITDGIISPVMGYKGEVPAENTLDYLSLVVLRLPEVKWTEESDEMISALAYGDVIMFADGQSGGLIIGAKNFAYRSVSEPDDEKVSKGPREGFVEPLMINISMLKRRLRTNKLKIEMKELGDKTGTACAVCYLEDVVDRSVLKQVIDGIDKIEADGVLGTSYVEEMTTEEPFAIFKRTGTTARPDVAAAKLLEHRAATWCTFRQEGAPAASPHEKRRRPWGGDGASAVRGVARP